MSPRAACRLATMGFEDIYDYVPGKADWLARALPMEGQKASEPRAIDFARHDAATCSLEDAIGEVRPAVEASPYGFALVVGNDGVLLGRLRRAALEGDQAARAADAMEPGPSTNRPDFPPRDLLHKLEKADLKTALLTDPDGRLLGLVHRADLAEEDDR